MKLTPWMLTVATFCMVALLVGSYIYKKLAIPSARATNAGLTASVTPPFAAIGQPIHTQPAPRHSETPEVARQPQQNHIADQEVEPVEEGSMDGPSETQKGTNYTAQEEVASTNSDPLPRPAATAAPQPETTNATSEPPQAATDTNDETVTTQPLLQQPVDSDTEYFVSEHFRGGERREVRIKVKRFVKPESHQQPRARPINPEDIREDDEAIEENANTNDENTVARFRPGA